MTLTTSRSAGPGRSTQTPGSTPHRHRAQFSSAVRHVARPAPAHAVRSQQEAVPVWSLLLPSYCTNNPTEEAMPDPNAGPSHEPGARILGGPS